LIVSDVNEELPGGKGFHSKRISRQNHCRNQLKRNGVYAAFVLPDAGYKQNMIKKAV
jgi:hypothetical protein